MRQRRDVRRAARGVALGAIAVALTGCSGAVLPGQPQPTEGVITPTFATPTASVAPTLVAPGAHKTPSMGGVRLAPTGGGPLNGKVVAVDPGHNKHWITAINAKTVYAYGTGGRNCQSLGATGPDKKTLEADLVWDIGQRVANDLRSQGATVVLTRPDNDGIGPCNDERAKIANANKADLLLSIHADGADVTDKRGYFVMYSNKMLGGPSISNESLALAQNVIEQVKLHSTIPQANYYAGETGIKESSKELAVLNTMITGPAVLVEVANLSNAEDWAAISSEGGRQALADGLTEAVADTLARPKPTPTPVKWP